MYDKNFLRQKLAIFDQSLIEEIWAKSKIVEVEAEKQILKAGQFIRAIPIVLSGVVNVYAFQDEKEFLLYHIQENESCIMSYTACIHNEASQIFAITESTATLLLMPVEEVRKWSTRYPEFNAFYLKFYQKRYLDILDTLRHVVFEHLDERILTYLRKKCTINGLKQVKITHKQIASDLATTREVVSRVLKKLEIDQKIEVVNGHIVLGQV